MSLFTWIYIITSKKTDFGTESITGGFAYYKTIQ